MNIGIVGSRRRDKRKDCKMVEDVLVYWKGENVDDVTIVSGGCPKGGDRFAEELAKKYGLTIIIHHPNWGQYGKSAGFVRNGKIVEDSDILVACVAKDRTGGTEDTVKKAYGAGMAIYLVQPNGSVDVMNTGYGTFEDEKEARDD